MEFPSDPLIGGTRISFERWPAVVMTTPPEVTDDELERFFEWWQRDVETLAEPFILVNDARRTKNLTASQRKIISGWMDPSRDSPLLGTALVFESKLLRGLLTAMFWINRPSYPVKVFNDLSQAIAWSQATVAEHTSPPAERRQAS